MFVNLESEHFIGVLTLAEKIGNVKVQISAVTSYRKCLYFFIERTKSQRFDFPVL